MNKKDLRILLVSSRPPEHSANLGGDIVNALQQKGCIVDFLSLYPSTKNNPFNVYTILDNQPESKSEFLRKRLSPFLFNTLKKLLSPIKNLLKTIVVTVSKKRKIDIHCHKAGFYYVDEINPEINPELLLNKIPQNKYYDLIISLFWENMLNSTSLKAIHKRFRVPIYVYSVDMAPMTGGCYYFNTCNRYKYGCGQCPCLLSNNIDDRSHQNYLIKKANYSETDIYFMGNSWMIERAIASKLFDLNSVLNMSIIIDEAIFCPQKSSQARLGLNIPHQYDLVLLARSSNDRRKGSEILEYAVKKLWENLSDRDQERLCLVSVGDQTLQKKLKGEKIPVINFGLVDKTTLINLYQISTLFLNPSIDDAGPSMVNQSMMCGTPVVSFNIGTAVDVIENGISGFKTDNICEEGFSQTLNTAINTIINHTYPHIKETTRRKALEYNTSHAFADKLLNHFTNRKLKNDK